MSKIQEPSLLDKAFSPFAEVKPGEGTQLFLLLLNIFLILVAYYILKPVREGLLTGGFFGLSSSNTKIAVAGLSAALLFIVVPGYSKIVDAYKRAKVINLSMGFACISLLIFVLLGRSGVRVGAAFYLWLSVVNVFLIAQFWSYANDIYTQEAGKRLFAVIAIGGSAGAIVGSWLAGHFKAHTYGLLLASAALLAFATFLYNLIDKTQTEDQAKEEEQDVEKTKADDNDSKQGGFSLVFRSKYLRLIAAMIMLTNIVNTTGEFVLFKAASNSSETAFPDTAFPEIQDAEERKQKIKEARKSVITGFYGNFFFIVNLVSFLLQAFIVSRILKWLGVRTALFVLPVLAFGGYFLIALFGSVMIVRIAKTIENSVDYSLQNTVKQALFLPTTREEKYKAKAAIDTFFVRGGDLLAAAVSLGLGAGLGLSLNGFAWINTALIALWILITFAIFKEHKKLTKAS